MPQVGDKAPLFSLPDQQGQTVKLKELLAAGQPVVLYFYPRDDTPGCTTEACNFRDALPQFQTAGVPVVGISADTVASHLKFATKFSLPFPLLADESHEICEKYGVWVEKSMYGKKSMGIQRATFLIDAKGKIAAVWPKVKVDGHVDAVIAALQELK